MSGNESGMGMVMFDMVSCSESEIGLTSTVGERESVSH